MGCASNKVENTFRFDKMDTAQFIRLGGTALEIGIIASDLDGTFLRDDHQFDRARFQAQLNRMNQQGQHFVVASGNQLQHCLDVLEGIQGELTYVAENGGLVVDNHGQVLHKSVLDPVVAQQLMQFVATTPELQGAQVSLSGEKGTYIRPEDDSPLMRYYLSNLHLVDDLTTVADRFFKVTFSWENVDPNVHADLINQHFAGRARATVMGGDGLDVIAPNVNKAAGLAYLQDLWQIPASQTAAFGDNGNDLEMLAEADYSYAMANAAAHIRDTANYVTAVDNNHDCVLDVIDQLI